MKRGDIFTFVPGHGNYLTLQGTCQTCDYKKTYTQEQMIKWILCNYSLLILQICGLLTFD
jgi:hypothetical protein